jgi:Flp pilus assembly pilin Flp
MRILLMAIINDTSGVTMVEYAMMVAVIAFAVMASAVLFGQNLLDLYESLKLPGLNENRLG